MSSERHVEHLIIEEYELHYDDSGNLKGASSEDTPLNHAISYLFDYADIAEYDLYRDLADKEWFDESSNDLPAGFDHAKTLHDLEKSLPEKGYTISKSFLILDNTHLTRKITYD